MEKIAIPCSCGCSVVVVMEFEQFGDDPQQFFVEFFTAYREKDSRRARWQAAWRVFRGKDPWLHDVCLDPTEIAKLRDFLSERLGN